MRTVTPPSDSEAKSASIPVQLKLIIEQTGTGVTLQMCIQEVIDLNLNRNTKYPEVSDGFSSISEQMP
jgi:hypothetical protein